jgi:hypothetical protein
MTIHISSRARHSDGNSGKLTRRLATNAIDRLKVIRQPGIIQHTQVSGSKFSANDRLTGSRRKKDDRARASAFDSQKGGGGIKFVHAQCV